MEDDDLEKAISSFLQCGNGISRRSLSLLTTTISKAAELEPEILILVLKKQLCDLVAPLAPPRVLLAISQILENLDANFFSDIISKVIKMDPISTNSSVINCIHNSVFILPVNSLGPDKANEMSNKIINLLQQTIKTESFFIILATALSQFMKKWATILPHPENATMMILSIVSDPTLNYSSISLLSQSAIYCICALIKSMSRLKDMISSLVERKETPLDKCTAVSGITFMEYVQQTIPRGVQFQLVASLLFTVPSEYYPLFVPNAYLIYSCISTEPTDEIEQTSFFQMLSAAIKVMSKSNQTDFLMRCKDAILYVTDTSDAYLRKSIRQCFTSLVQCALKTCDESYFVDIFNKVVALPSKSSLKQDCLSLVIPYVPFSLITKDFFAQLLSLVDYHQAFAFRCISEIYKNHDVLPEYSDMLFVKLDELSSVVRQNLMNTILKTSLKVVKTLHKHVAMSRVIPESKRLSIQVQIAPGMPQIDRNMIRLALHSWNYEIRIDALKLLITSQRGSKKFSPEDIALLSEAIPRVFVYCDVKYQKVLERFFQMACNRMDMHDQTCMSQFLSPLFKAMVPLLKPRLSGFRKSYIINTFNIVWNSRPLLFLTKELLENLVYNLFESSYTVRDLIFRFLLLILRTKEPSDKANLAHQVISESSPLVSDLIQEHSKSTKFRETDGTARLIALVHLAKGGDDIEGIISKMWQEIVEVSSKKKTETIPPHFPLSVVLHVLQSVQDPQIDFNFISSKLMKRSIKIIDDSLVFIGVDTNIETMPVQSIKGGDAPVSQLNDDINRSWLAVRQALNIIGYVLNKYFERLPVDLIRQTGDTLLRFLIGSRHPSTVYHAHLIFQTICTLSFTRDVTKDFSNEWASALIAQSDVFTLTDHKTSNGFVLSALALIHSEPSHLFAQQRPIYDKFIRLCNAYIAGEANDNQLITGFLLAQSIAADNLTQSNFEPYLSQLLMTCFKACAMTAPYSTKNICNICLCTLLLKHWKRRSDTRHDLEAISHVDFFSVVNGASDFFVEHLVSDQPDVAYIILIVIQFFEPFPMDNLLARIIDMRSSPSSRSRRAAARALIVVLPQGEVENFIRSALLDVPKADANTLDGILMQIKELTSAYTNVIDSLKSDVEKILVAAMESHEKSYIRLYLYINLANIFGLTHIVKPVLLVLFNNVPALLKRPYGQRILVIIFKVMTETELLQVIIRKDRITLFHACRFLADNPSYLKRMIARSLIDIFLRDPAPAVYDRILKLLINFPEKFNPNDYQKEQFNKLILKDMNQSRLMPLLRVASMFIVDAKLFLEKFENYWYFVDRSDTDILETLSIIMENHREELFTEFDPKRYTHWLLALRIISDENPSVRLPCCRALSHYIFFDKNQKIELSEYDLILGIYAKMSPYKDLLQRTLQTLHNTSEQIEDDNGVKRDPTPFIHPPSFHAECLRYAYKSK